MEGFVRIKEIVITCACYTLIAVMPVLLSGCAVGMALHGKEEPEITDIDIGMPMDTVHFIMRNYTPKILTEGDYRVEEYKVEIGNEPSAGRALGHLAMDVLTWGVWEIVGTPLEGFSSKNMVLKITYEKINDGWFVKDLKAGKERGGV